MQKRTEIEKNVSMEFGIWLQDIRYEQGLTREKACDKLPDGLISNDSIKRHELGKTMPNFYQFLLYLLLYGIDDNAIVALLNELKSKIIKLIQE
ncbi:MAG: hypothetical protein NC393_13315 [Clostridium sp.]|nr:hypothetical protein [Clostridium sp.]MCM1173090.1 hypothetical protein [Clostridium sp.]MCM1208089.1 hypothetical protein [Ruminococcus sp.]